MKMTLGGALALLALAGCETTPTTVAQPADCGAAAMQVYLGQTFTQSMIPPGADPVRVGGPTTAMTADFNPNRLTVLLDAEGKLEEAKCQ
ncbi:I78 family peptidase inhibitor [Pseudooceanicola nanhaiensis]|mgnify:CR=1 FL=1|uniref:I78 family peptidase inhibitor n=1 Tax=Pseudooceanicola nanhaiensis TaxID=375761 RepID=UPI003514B457